MQQASAGARAIAPTPIQSAGFARIPRDIAKRPDLTDAEHRLLLVLTAQAHYDHRLGRHRPVRISNSHLVRCLSWSTPKLRRVRTKLEGRELLTVTAGTGHRKSEYRLQLETETEVTGATAPPAETETPTASREVQSVSPGVTRVTPLVPRAPSRKNVSVSQQGSDSEHRARRILERLGVPKSKLGCILECVEASPRFADAACDATVAALACKNVPNPTGYFLVAFGNIRDAAPPPSPTPRQGYEIEADLAREKAAVEAQERAQREEVAA